MTSSIEFIDFVCEQLRDFPNIRYRKMFGEYTIYINDKPLILVCNDTVYIKIVPELAELMSDAPTAIPYDGAKLRYILDIENPDLTREALQILDDITPMPKPKKPRTKSQ